EFDNDFTDEDYHLSESDDDFNDAIVEPCTRKKRGRPKKTANNPSFLGISDFASSEELNDVKFDIEDEEEREVTYVEYDEDKNRDNSSLKLGMKLNNLK
ncbi:hypothetical protein HAX54_022348, partial [Datura stramonium]|nr:hypothetical protein [Datura stramonium]